MLYLIGGAPRAGKSTLARRLLIEDQVPYCSLDYITSMFQQGAPELGITHYLPTLERAELLWPRVEHWLAVTAEREPDYLVDGEAFLPKLIANRIDFLKENARTCFFGYAEADLEEKFHIVKEIRSVANDWVQYEQDAKIRSVIAEAIEFSKFLRDECAQYGLPYFDTSHDFSGQIEEARRYLLQPVASAEPIPAKVIRPTTPGM